MAENFVSLLEATARRFPEKTALVWDGGSLSYEDLHARAAGFARSLAGRGIGHGDMVALLIPNRWDFVVALLGGFKLGATMVPLSARIKKGERADIMGDLKPRLVVEEVEVEEGFWRTAPEVDAPAMIAYTSGSTGQPKGAIISHQAVTFANHSWAKVMALRPDDVVLGVLPLAHSFGLNGALLAPLLVGSTVALLDRFSPEAVLDSIREFRVTVFPGVATMFRRVLSSPALAGTNLSSLRLAVAGAAPCPWELVEEWRQRIGTRILRGYGMAELFRPISYLAEDPRDWPDAAGRAVAGVEVRVVDDADRPLGPGEVGELLIKSPSALEGYLNDPGETRAVLVDGWFKTGDLATISPEGLVRIVGRKRERILRGGYSVFPHEVEAVLLSHPTVAEAAVVGLPNPDLGEEVVAFVTFKRGAKVSSETLSTYCQERLAGYKYPRQINFLKRLPKGATGKVVKSELVKMGMENPPQ